MNNKNRFDLYISVALIAALLFSLLAVYASSAQTASAGRIGTSARAATLYVPELDEFLYSENSSERLPMASTTKIMTALVAVENSQSNETVKIADGAIGIEGSSAYLKKGDVLTMEELLYALLLQSANDAAAAIAYHISGSVEDFAALMNEKAAELGLSDTCFTNPHGLDDENHYTTAHDLALIGAAALKNENIKKITSTYKKSFITEERSRTYVNHNKLLKLYDGAIGMKTGFTKKSGRCLVGAAERDGLTLVSVTLDAPSDWSDHARMLDYGFASIEKITLAEPFEYRYTLPVIGGAAEAVTVSNEEGSSVIVKRGEGEFSHSVRLAKFAVAPVRKGDVLGEVIFTLDGEKTETVKLIAAQDVAKAREDGFFGKILNFGRSIFK